jgi:hypothetical protein
MDSVKLHQESPKASFDPKPPVTNDCYPPAYLRLYSSIVKTRNRGGPPPCISL